MKAGFLFVIASLVALAACTRDVGVRIEDFKPANSPAGASTELRFQHGFVKKNRLQGELLAVDDEGVVLLLAQPLETGDGRTRFVEAPFGILRAINVEQLGAARVRSEGAAIDAARLARLRQLSRFPQGIDETLRARLLATYGEASFHIPQKAAKSD